MFVEMTSLEETRAYKEIYSKGAAEGEERGEKRGEERGETKGRIQTIKEEIERLSLLRSQNVLNKSLFEILANPLKKELKYLEVLLKKS